jgi:hypothetical protein
VYRFICRTHVPNLCTTCVQVYMSHTCTRCMYYMCTGLYVAHMYQMYVLHVYRFICRCVWKRIESVINTFIIINVRVRVMVFNATFNNISVISWRSVLVVEETGVPCVQVYMSHTCTRCMYYMCTGVYVAHMYQFYVLHVYWFLWVIHMCRFINIYY